MSIGQVSDECFVDPAAVRAIEDAHRVDGWETVIYVALPDKHEALLSKWSPARVAKVIYDQVGGSIVVRTPYDGVHFGVQDGVHPDVESP